MILEVFIGISVLIWFWVVTRRKQNGPPGPMPLPIFGNLHQILIRDWKRPHVLFHKLARSYGEIMNLNLGSSDVVVLTSSEAIRNILGKHGLFKGVLQNESLKVRYLNQRLGISYMDKVWQDQRSLLSSHLKSFYDPGNQKHPVINSLITKELNELVSRIYQKMADGRQVVLYMHNYFNVSIINLLWTMISGVRYTHDNENLLKLVKCVNAIVKCESTGNPMLSSMFSTMRKLVPKLKAEEKQLLESSQMLHKLVHELIREKRQKSKEHGWSHGFLDTYLQEIDNLQGKLTSSCYTEDSLETMCADFLLAGSDSTSNTLCFAMLYMMLYPKIQEKVYEELSDLMETDSNASPELTSKFPYTQAVLLEIQRVTSVIPFTAPHILTEDVSHEKFKIHKGTVILGNLFSVNMDQQQWDDPQAFRPERFLDKNGKLKNDKILITFDGEKSNCIEKRCINFTILFQYFTKIIKLFQLETVPGHLSPSAEPILGFSLSPKPFHTVVTCRR